MRILVFGLLLVAAACSAGPRYRAFQPARDGAEQAIAVLLNQPPNTYGRLQLTVPFEAATAPTEQWEPIQAGITSVRGPDEAWCDFPCKKLFGIKNVLGYDSDETGGAGLAPERTFAATLEGVRSALAWRDEKPRDVRHVAVERALTYAPGAGPNWQWAWRDVSGDLSRLFATERHVCFYALCLPYTDVRGLFVTGRARGEPPTIQEQHAVTPETLPGLLLKLKARPEPQLTFMLETLEPRHGSGWRSVDLNAVSLLEEDRICGLAAEPPTFNEERCYAFAEVRQISVRDYNRTAGEVIGDALTTPFRVLGAVGQSMAIGAH
jgi:hypothetical protein